MTKRITLRTLKARPELAFGFARLNVRIWSGEHCAWWRPERRGYTTEESEAGVYPWAEAWDVTCHCGNEKKITYVAVTA